MKNLLAFLGKYYHWLLFVFLEVASFVLLFRFNSYQGSVYFTTANALAGSAYEMNAHLESFFSLTAVNEQLTQRNLYLEQQVQQMRQRLEDATGDSALLHYSQLQLLGEYKLIPAKVVTNSTSLPDNLITIDKGSVDGVKVDMGVASGNGVVGVVYMVGSHYSIVIPVLNSHSHLSVVLERSGFFGSLSWTGGAPDVADMNDVPRHAQFRWGERVVTSGYSSIFPPGVLVGHVLHVYNSRDGLSYRVQVKLSSDFSRLRDVCVIDNSRMQERIDLMRAARDSIKPIER